MQPKLKGKALAPRELAAVKHKIETARTQIILDHPFFACLLVRRPLVERAVGTLAVDARGTIYYDPQFVNRLTVPELVFGFCHEVMHNVLCHALRLMGRDHRKWNKAGDCVINEMLIAENIGQFIEGGMRWPGANNMTTDEVYNALPDSPNGDGGEGEGNDGYGDGEGDYGLGDDLIDEPMSEAERSEAEANAKVELVQAATAAKMQGKLPASIARMVDEIIAVKTPWYEILERYMMAFTKDDTSWRRPDRRTIGKRIYLPSTDTKFRMGKVCIQLDTSGSIGAEELKLFLGHINRIVDQCKPEEVIVLHTDSRVAHVERYTPDDMPIVIDHLYGGGGTDMTKGFQWLDDEQEKVDVIVTLTDGYTPFLDTISPAPDIWLITSHDIESPTGVTVHPEF